MEYKALTQSTIKITKEVTINNAIDFSLAGMPRLGAIKASMAVNDDDNSKVPADPDWGTKAPKALFPAKYGYQVTSFNCYNALNEISPSSSNADIISSSTTYSSKASDITSGVIIDYNKSTTAYPVLNPEEMSYVELDGKRYYGYKNAYYVVYSFMLNQLTSTRRYYYFPFKGKVTVVIYKAASKTIDTIERTFNGIETIYSADHKEYIYRGLSSNTKDYYSYSCLVVPKETDDLVLGIFVDDIEEATASTTSE